MKPIDKIKGEIHMKSKKLLLKRLIPVIVVILTVVFIWLCTSKNDLKNDLDESTGNTTESSLMKVTTRQSTTAETTEQESTSEETTSEESSTEETTEQESETDGTAYSESTTVQNSQTAPPEIQTTEAVTTPNTEPLTGR